MDAIHVLDSLLHYDTDLNIEEHLQTLLVTQTKFSD